MKLNLDKINIMRLSLRFIAIFCGFFIIANGIVFTINANLGVMPWDVLHIGISYHVGISLGRVMQIVGLALVAFSYILKIHPHIGTVLNMIFVGFFVDLVIKMDYIPPSGSLLSQIFLYVIGVVLIGIGIALYISANLGAGPRDSLMLALTKATRFQVGTIRTFMEVVVTLLGYLMGGPLGIGTVIFALSIGSFMNMGFTLIRLFKNTLMYKYIWGININQQ